MRGVQREQSHSHQHMLPHTLRDFIRKLILPCVAPEDQHIRVCQNFLTKPVFRHFKCRRPHGDIRFLFQKCGNAAMNAVRIDLSYIFIFLFMYELVINRDPYLFSHFTFLSALRSLPASFSSSRPRLTSHPQGRSEVPDLTLPVQ